MDLEKKIRRYKLMDIHRDLIRTGKYQEAVLILKLLRRGYIKLYLGDTDFSVECICEEIGCRTNYGRNGYTATVIL